jgi:hypothetical protein
MAATSAGIDALVMVVLAKLSTEGGLIQPC